MASRPRSNPRVGLPRAPDASAIRVLVVDGNEEMRSALHATLARAGYAVEAVGTAATALRRTLTVDYGLIVMDLLLPDGDGRMLLGRLRAARPHAVIVVLTKVSDAATKIRCLEKGALDYVTKPFSPQELLVRVRLRLEAATARADGHGPPRDGLLARATGDGGDETARLRLDVDHLTADAGRGPVRLTRTEFVLLKTLADNAGQPMPARRLLTEVWGYGFEPQSNVVGVCVRRLRSKLGSQLIMTVRGEGYQLEHRTAPLSARRRRARAAPGMVSAPTAR